MRALKAGILALILAAVALAACSRPRSSEQYVRRAMADGGRYEFRLNLSDTAARYDISIYTRRDGADNSGFPLRASWYLEDSLRFSEDLFFPPSDELVPYRSGVAMEEAAEWKLVLQPFCPPEGLRGMGVICKERD
ncbi:MAG: hypothetical protein J5764_03095 [Bacteroidales bacterium]|nr:hypothetical protein [Bacteroidales bacterium]